MSRTGSAACCLKRGREHAQAGAPPSVGQSFLVRGCDKDLRVAASVAGTAACSGDLYLRLESGAAGEPSSSILPLASHTLDACRDLGSIESAGVVSPGQAVVLQLRFSDGLMSGHLPHSGTTSCVLNCCLLLLGHRVNSGKAAAKACFREKLLCFKWSHCFCAVKCLKQRKSCLCPGNAGFCEGFR